MSVLADEILTAPEVDARKALITASDAELHSLMASKNDDIVDLVFQLLDQRLANRLFSGISKDLLRAALGRAGDSSLAHVLTLINPRLLTELLAHASNELVERIISSASSSKIRANVIKALPVARQSQWKQMVHQQETEIRHTRQLAEEGKSSLLGERIRLLEEINAAIRTKEQVLKSFEDEARIKTAHHAQLLADAQARLASMEDVIAKRQATVDARERALAARLAELEEENRRQVQEKIELKVPEYVTAALKVLEDREKAYRKKAAQWTTHGTAVLLVAIVATAAISVYGYGLTSSVEALSWQALLFISFKGLVILGVLGLWAKHAFTVSNAYMHEAIKRSDRAHAITFGKLYLEIYGNTVDRKELLDIFENWNITSESAFSKVSPPSFDPKIIDQLGSFLKLSERGKSAG